MRRSRPHRPRRPRPQEVSPRRWATSRPRPAPSEERASNVLGDCSPSQRRVRSPRRRGCRGAEPPIRPHTSAARFPCQMSTGRISPVLPSESLGGRARTHSRVRPRLPWRASMPRRLDRRHLCPRERRKVCSNGQNVSLVARPSVGASGSTLSISSVAALMSPRRIAMKAAVGIDAANAQLPRRQGPGGRQFDPTLAANFRSGPHFGGLFEGVCVNCPVRLLHRDIQFLPPLRPDQGGDMPRRRSLG